MKINLFSALLIVTSPFFEGTKVNADEAPLVILGMGNMKCASYSAYLHEHNETTQREHDLAVFTWASGFFSGLNVFHPERRIRDLRTPEFRQDALMTRLSGKCLQTPEHSLVEMLADIYGEMPSERP